MERLKSRKVIESLFKEGKSVAVHPVRITYKEVPGQASPLQAGFSVSSRNFKKAVDRNRIKRLLRESYRKQKSLITDLPGSKLHLEIIAPPGDAGLVDAGLVATGLPAAGTQSLSIPIAVFIIFTGKELPTFQFVDEKMKLALLKLAGQLTGRK